MNSTRRDRDPVAKPTVLSVTAAAVVASLYDHPHDDTPQAISAVIDDPRVTAIEVAEALEELGVEGLVHSDGVHWQLTTAGYRSRRAAP